MDLADLSMSYLGQYLMKCLLTFPFIKGEFPLFFVALMTFILIMSSVTMVLAVNYGHKMKKKQVILWLSLTIIGGITFLGSQAWEWGALYSRRQRCNNN